MYNIHELQVQIYGNCSRIKKDRVKIFQSLPVCVGGSNKMYVSHM